MSINKIVASTAIVILVFSAFVSYGSADSIKLGAVSARPQPTAPERPRRGTKRVNTAFRPTEKFDGKTITKSEDEWRKLLSPEQFTVLRQKGTERAYTGKYTNNHRRGTYYCAACGLALFRSANKFESGTGWPSFYKPIAKPNVTEAPDTSLGEVRTEIKCSRCGSHLGHVFDDGPKPTGLRYCINSVALVFRQA